MKTIDLVGIGNPLMDIIIKIEDDILVDLNLKKGIMNLVDEEQLQAIEKKLAKHDSKLVPGGSVANTLSGFAVLGGSAVYMGMAGTDSHGDVYEEKLEGGNVKSKISRETGRTGTVISLVSPDSERTFATFFGVCMNLRKDNVIEDDIKAAKYLYLDGYQMEDKQLRETSLHAIELAKKHGTLIAIDLADPALVKRNREDILNIIKSADVLFANEEEIQMLTGKSPEKSLDELDWIDTLIVKVGSKGSMARHRGTKHSVKAKKVKAVDTMGAGDMYAAGILYGMTHGMDIVSAMELASHVAARIVETVGARIEGGLDPKDINMAVK